MMNARALTFHALLLGALASPLAGQAVLAQAYDPFAAANAAAPPAPPPTLGDVGRAAAEQVRENQRKAAQALDRGVRGQGPATGVRGGAAGQAASAGARGTLTGGDPATAAASMMAKAGLDSSTPGGQASAEILRQAIVQTQAGGGSTCVLPTADQSAGRASGEAAMREYMAALSSGNAAGIGDAVRRGQNNTTLMNREFADGPRCKDAPSPPFGGQPTVGGQGPGPGQITDAILPADILDEITEGPSARERAEATAEYDRLYDQATAAQIALLHDPKNPEKQAALEKADEALLIYGEDHGGKVGLPHMREREKAEDAEYHQAVLTEYDRLYDASTQAQIELLRDPNNPEKEAALERADEAVLFFSEDNGSASDQPHYREREASAQVQFKAVILTEYDRRHDAATEAWVDLIRDPNNAAKEAAVERADEAVLFYAEDYGSVDQQGHYREKEAAAQRRYEEVATSEFNRMTAENQRLAQAAGADPEDTGKQAAYAAATAQTKAYTETYGGFVRADAAPGGATVTAAP